jgi:asparagine synthase (glutamine-hydrolysing)
MACQEIFFHKYKIFLRDKWFRYNNTFIKGSAFVKGELYEKEKLAKYIDSLPFDSFELYEELNGFFCIIKYNEERVQLVSDRIRSLPVFYGQGKEYVYISDDPYEIKNKLNICEFNEVSKKELMLLRYVSGSETLYEGIKQIEAAQVINFSKGTASSQKYYIFSGKHDINGKREELIKKHEEVLYNVFKRLITYAAGRTIVLPLSGGYDSRIVAVMLKKLNYQRVITFSFGMEGHPEQIISKMVAEALGFKWIFIPYTNEKTYNWYNSSEYKEFEYYGDNLSSNCFDRDWPAIYELKTQNLIPNDSVIVPGHSGDFLSGRFLPYNLGVKGASVDELVEYIFETQYTQWDWSGKKNEFGRMFKDKIINILDLQKQTVRGTMLDLYDVWEWQERQSKYIVNSIRTYDYFGYNWWLPLWDKEILDFWMGITNKWRRRRSLYSYHVALMYSKLAKIPLEQGFVREETLYDTSYVKAVKKIKDMIINSALEPFIVKPYNSCKRIYRLIKPVDNFSGENMDTDWEVASGRYNKDIYKTLLPYIVTRDSCKTLKRLGYINNKDTRVADEVLNMLRDMKG